MKNLNHYLITHVLKQYLAIFPDSSFTTNSCTVALSGGIDSVVLLHILNTIRKNKHFDLQAIHVNHGISKNSNKWQKFCENLCAELSIPLSVHNYQITKLGGESLENNARIKRYEAFYSLKTTTIALAHHQNDQIETTLVQIFRGSDLHNIAAMKSVNKKLNKIFWRPLLNIPKSIIEDYKITHNLTYINDESNIDTKYLRNFIRHQILPNLQQFDPHINNKILNINNQLQNMLSLVDQLAKDDLNQVQDHFTNDEHLQINVLNLQKLTHTRQLNLIAYFIKQHQLHLPSNKQLGEFVRQVLQSGPDKKPQLKLNEKYKIIKNKNIISIIKML